MKKCTRIISTTLLFISCSLFMTSSVFAKDSNKECYPGYHNCEAPFSVNNDEIAKPEKPAVKDCNPAYHECMAPFTLSSDKIAPVTHETDKYCNPNYHSCEAPFVLGK